MSEKKQNVYIIAEAGVNHNGSLEQARDLVDVAVESGVDAIKFQTFKTDLCITKNAKRANYQKVESEADTQYEMVKNLELDWQDFRLLRDYCHKRGIEFLSTAFDLPSLSFLSEELDVSLIKIPSGDILNGPLLLAAAKTGKNIIVSTGMCSLGDIEKALSVLAYGFLYESYGSPCEINFKNAFYSPQGQDVLKSKVSLLHCTTEYPAPFEDLNLASIHTLRSAFGLNVGLSDHSLGLVAPIVAVALGAKIIEKHFTLDKSMPGPDHKASLSPKELYEVVKSIKNASASIGDGKKFPRQSEIKNVEIARKYLVANGKIFRGQVIAENDLIAKRATKGIDPIYLWDIVGRISGRNYSEDDVISMSFEE